MKDIKGRLEEWYEQLRRDASEHPLLEALRVELVTRFPELVGTQVEITEPTQELHPMQQVILGPDKVIRFRQNKIVRDLIDHTSTRGFDLNDIAARTARGDYSKADAMQLSQLMGYSVSGYGDLSWVTDESYGAAERALRQILKKPSV